MLPWIPFVCVGISHSFVWLNHLKQSLSRHWFSNLLIKHTQSIYYQLDTINLILSSLAYWDSIQSLDYPVDTGHSNFVFKSHDSLWTKLCNLSNFFLLESNTALASSDWIPVRVVFRKWEQTKQLGQES